MSNLNPKGKVIEFNGEERRLLFTINAVDRIQSDMEEPVFDVLKRLGSEETFYDTIRYFISVLLEDEAERAKALQGVELKKYSEKEVGWVVTFDKAGEYADAILEAYGISNPEPDEDSDPNHLSGNTNK